MTKDQFKAGDLITIRLTPLNARFLNRGRGSVYIRPEDIVDHRPALQVVPCSKL